MKIVYKYNTARSTYTTLGREIEHFSDESERCFTDARIVSLIITITALKLSHGGENLAPFQNTKHENIESDLRNCNNKKNIESYNDRRDRGPVVGHAYESTRVQGGADRTGENVQDETTMARNSNAYSPR